MAACAAKSRLPADEKAFVRAASDLVAFSRIIRSGKVRVSDLYYSQLGKRHYARHRRIRRSHGE